MTNLTEQWKKGELPRGWYFVKFADETYPDYYNGYFVQTGDRYGIEVLAPVPSYDEYLESEAHCAVYSEENKQLRQLLKECLVYIPYSYPQFQTEKRIDLDSAKLDLLTRIKSAIGESEE